VSGQQRPPNRQGPKAGVPRGAYKEHLKQPFLDAFRKTGFIYQACDAVGVNRHTVLQWRRTDQAFADEFRESEGRTTEVLERSALQRAVVGDQKPVYHNGKVVGHVLEKSDLLTIFLLKARDRKKYGDRLVHDVQIRFASGLLAEVMKALRGIPTACPHCKTRLDVKEQVGQHLLELSKSFDPEDATV